MHALKKIIKLYEIEDRFEELSIYINVYKYLYDKYRPFNILYIIIDMNRN